MEAQYLVEIIEETAQVAYVRETLLAAQERRPADLPKFGAPADAAAASERNEGRSQDE